MHIYKIKSVCTVLHTQLASKPRARTKVATTGKTITPRMYPQVLNYLPRTYATDEDTADTKDGIATFLQPTSNMPSQYAEEFVAKTLRGINKK